MYSLYGIVALAQTCGTVPTEAQVNYMRSFETASVRDMVIAQGIIDIPIQFHIITKNDGSGGIGVDTIEEQLNIANRIFIKSNIRFIQANAINYINNTEFYDFRREQRQEDLFAQKHNLPQVINIYCANKLILESGGLCFGYTYHPEKSRNRRIRVFMSRAGFENISSFSHELGHFFGLYHTHEKKQGERFESINRVIDFDRNGTLDCYETGDDLCDTPADPNIGNYSEFCSPQCFLKGSININGKNYIPLVDNLMCYNNQRNCRTKLTEEQYARVAQFARNEWKDLRITNLGNRQKIQGTIYFKLKNKKSMPVKLKDVNLYQFKKAYTTGTSFLYKVRNKSSVPFYVSILNMDDQMDEVNSIPANGEAVKIEPKEQIIPIKKYIKLSAKYKQPTREYICLLVSLAPINHQTIGDAMEKEEGTFTQKIYKTIGDKLLPQRNVTYLSGEELNFEGVLRKNEILPIMLEMEHLPK